MIINFNFKIGIAILIGFVANNYRLRLLDAIVFKRHDDEGISSTDMPTVDKILDVCPNLESLTVNGFPPAIDLRYSSGSNAIRIRRVPQIGPLLW